MQQNLLMLLSNALNICVENKLKNEDINDKKKMEAIDNSTENLVVEIDEFIQKYNAGAPEGVTFEDFKHEL